jgi:hypothetical protein
MEKISALRTIISSSMMLNVWVWIILWMGHGLRFGFGGVLLFSKSVSSPMIFLCVLRCYKL